MPSRRQLTPEDHAHPHPVYVVWELTLRCDQACRHCGSRAGRPRDDELTAEESLDLVAQMAGLGVREVTLIGGESYLRDDWIDIAAALTARGVGVSMVTGGRGLTPEIARAAAEAGVEAISVSIDGMGPTHDTLRAVPGSFEAALRAMDHIGAAGMVPTVNTQLNQRNHGELVELLDVLLAHGMQTWQFQLTTPMGRAADRDRLVLQPYHLLDLMPALEGVSHRARASGCRVLVANNLGYYGPHEHVLRAGGHWIGCTGGKWTLGIQSDGTVKACGSLPTAPYGDTSVRDRPLAEIVEQSAAIRAVAEGREQGLWGFCADCYYAETCKGGCVWTAHTLLGRPGNQPFCHHRALELQARGRRERLEPVAPAPGERFDCGRWEIIEEDWVER